MFILPEFGRRLLSSSPLLLPFQLYPMYFREEYLNDNWGLINPSFIVLSVFFGRKYEGLVVYGSKEKKGHLFYIV